MARGVVLRVEVGMVIDPAIPQEINPPLSFLAAQPVQGYVHGFHGLGRHDIGGKSMRRCVVGSDGHVELTIDHLL